MVLRVWGRPGLMDKSKTRNIRVCVAGKMLCVWKAYKYDEYKVTIPAQLIHDNILEVVFEIDNPMTKKDDPAMRQFQVSFMQIN